MFPEIMGAMGAGGGGMPGMPGLSDQSMSSASLNVGAKTSGINLAGSDRGFPGFITASMGKVQSDEISANMPLIIAAAGLLALLFVLRSKK